MKVPEVPREAVKHKTYVVRHKTENIKRLGDIKREAVSTCTEMKVPESEPRVSETEPRVLEMPSGSKSIR